MGKIREILENQIHGFRQQLVLRGRTKRRRIFGERGVISFTFDDFPHSASTAGGSILAGAGIRATYYVAMGLQDTNSGMGRLFARNDLFKLLEAGHEIGCHTYSHMKCTQASAQELLEDIWRNEETISKELKIQDCLENFSYPNGEVTLQAKEILGRRFTTCRGVYRGINTSVVDLALLKANPLYSATFSLGHVASLIEETSLRKGWLIFYTHDVQDNPSKWGCTPEYLDTVCQYAVESECQVLPIKEALNELRIDV